MMSWITIELKSDLCAGTGTGFSSFVDTDISYDSHGIPYIPGRRLKGCLREAAEYYFGKDYPAIGAVFGAAGGQAGTFSVGNGQLPDIQLLHRYLDALDEDRRPTPDQVLDVFAAVRAATAVDEATGTAKQESLRFTRVLLQCIREKDGNFVFSFPCEDDGTQETEDLLTAACQALRSMGAHRNRGLGAVTCAYHTEEPSADSGQTDRPAAPAQNPQPCRAPLRLGAAGENQPPVQAMPLHVELLSPLLMSAAAQDDTKTYVSGTAVLGALAGLYLRHHGQADETFRRLFLAGEVSYGNLYISDAAGAQTVPAPYYIRKLKSSHAELDGKLITFFDDKTAFVQAQMPSAQEAVWAEAARLAQEKPLREKMVLLKDGGAAEYPVRTERVYHHSLHGVNRGLDGKTEDTSLYTQSCISAGQYLAGTILGPEELLSILRDLLLSYPLRLGKSRTAQYSLCRPAKGSLRIYPPAPPQPLHAQAGDSLALILESDYIPDAPGAPLLMLAREILPDVRAEDLDDAHTAADYHMIHGYHAKRNLRASPVRAVAMGSTVTIRLSRAVSFPDRYVLLGARTAEGFGRVRLETAQALQNSARLTKKSEAAPPALTQEETRRIGWFIQALARENISTAQMQANAAYADLAPALTGKGSSASFIGRLMLMAEQAETPQALKALFDSIKSKDADSGQKKREIANALYARVEAAGALWQPFALTVLRRAKYDLKTAKGGGENE